MSQPTAYARQNTFAQQVQEGSNKAVLLIDRNIPLGANLDADFNAILITLSQTLANLALIQRDDGALANESVHVNALSESALMLLNSDAWTPRGDWLTGTTYAALDIVEKDSNVYLALVDHIAGVFATDKAAGRWMLLATDALETALQAFLIYRNKQWTELAPAPTYVNATRFLLTGVDYTDFLTVNVRLKFIVSAIPVYATVLTSTLVGSDTQVDIQYGTANLTAGLTAAYVGIGASGRNIDYEHISAGAVTLAQKITEAEEAFIAQRIFVPLPDAPTQTSATTFTLPGDYTTGDYKIEVGARLYLDDATNITERVKSVSYNGGTDETTVEVTNYEGSLTVALSAVSIGVSDSRKPIDALHIFYDGDTPPAASSVRAKLQALTAQDTAIDTAVFLPQTLSGGPVAYTATLGISAYTANRVYEVIVNVANTGAATVNFDTLGAKNIKTVDGNDPMAGMMPVGLLARFLYNGTNMVLINPDNAARRVVKALTATTSGTTSDISFATGAKKIIASLNGVSTNGTSPLILQLGVGGTPETTGYNGVAISISAINAWTNGVRLRATNQTAAELWYGRVAFDLIDVATNLWSVGGGVGAPVTPQGTSTSGIKALAGLANMMRLTSEGGANTFDAGEWNLVAEY